MIYVLLLAVSTFTQGEQMIPVLNTVGTHCAVFGNHDFGMKKMSFRRHFLTYNPLQITAWMCWSN